MVGSTGSVTSGRRTRCSRRREAASRGLQRSVICDPRRSRTRRAGWMKPVQGRSWRLGDSDQLQSHAARGINHLTERGYSDRHDRSTDPRRRPDAAAARTTREDARRLARAEELGADTVFNWDHFYPLYGEADGPHFECWTMLGGDGRGDRARADRRAGDLQLLPQPQPAGRHGAHRRPHLGRAADPRHRRRLVPSATTTSTATSSARRPTGCATSAPRCRDPQRLAQAQPAARHGRPPILIGGGGEKVTLRIDRRARRHLARLRRRPTWPAHKRQVLDEQCATLGRDPAEIERSIGGFNASGSRCSTTTWRPA